MLINTQIELRNVKLVGEFGLSEMTLEQALDIAQNKGLDLMLVNPEQGICKLGDYAKMKYQEKKAKRKNISDKTEIKEVQLTPNIAKHDLDVKANTINRLLAQGKNTKVRITMKFKGRMGIFKEQGKALLQEFIHTNGWLVDKSMDDKVNSIQCVVSKIK